MSKYIYGKNKSTTKARLAALAILAAVVTSVGSGTAGAEPTSQNPVPKAAKAAKVVTPAKSLTPVPREDVVLIMPKQGADQDDVQEAIDKVNGEIIGELGDGTIRILMVKAQHGKAFETAGKLKTDKKNFAIVNANRKIYANYVPSTPDPGFADAWHLTRMHVPEAWDTTMMTAQSAEMIAVLDSGCQTYGSDLNSISSHGADVTGKDARSLAIIPNLAGSLGMSIKKLDGMMQSAGNRIETLTLGIFDKNGHGTRVATTAAGQLGNDKGGAGIQPRAAVFPIKIADGAYNASISTDDLSLVAAMMVMYQKGIRIVNISYGPLVDPDEHEVLHAIFKDWYYRKGGLTFISAGNGGEHWSEKDHPYINVISAMADIKSDMKLVNTKTWASAWGPCIDFTAPGQNIVCTNPNGTKAVVNGTSFSAPICAGIASLIWTVNPKLTNRQVEDVMRRTAVNTVKDKRNSFFGWGMPDARDAVALAKIMH